MLYSKLNKTQKRLVDAFIELKPDLATSTTITRIEVESLFEQLYDKRKDGGAKFGYPNWIVKDQRIARGLYRFPGPKAEQLTVVKSDKTSEVERIKTDIEVEKEFFKDIEKYGIVSEAA